MSLLAKKPPKNCNSIKMFPYQGIIEWVFSFINIVLVTVLIWCIETDGVVSPGCVVEAI